MLLQERCFWDIRYMLLQERYFWDIRYMLLQERYFWELVFNLRKFLMSVITVFLKKFRFEQTFFACTPSLMLYLDCGYNYRLYLYRSLLYRP